MDEGEMDEGEMDEGEMDEGVEGDMDEDKWETVGERWMKMSGRQWGLLVEE